MSGLGLDQQVRNSCLYKGTIRHRRFTPVANQFKYRMFMWYIDLDELDQVIKQHWFVREGKLGIASFHREDYFGEKGENLKLEVLKAVQSFYQKNQQASPEVSSVRMLTHVRYFGVVINPVSFYYCFDKQDQLQVILAEITNTPWGEKHTYILPCSNLNTEAQPTKTYRTNDRLPLIASQLRQNTVQFDFEKAFHVSPFNPMQMDYRWVFKAPSEKLTVHMDNLIHAGASDDTEQLDQATLDDVSKHFDATLNMTREPLTKALGSLAMQPIITLKVALGIYWQALRLFLTGVPLHPHPDRQVTEIESTGVE